MLMPSQKALYPELHYQLGRCRRQSAKKSWSRTIEATLYPYSVVYICNKKFPIKKKGSRHLLQTYLVAAKVQIIWEGNQILKQPPNFLTLLTIVKYIGQFFFKFLTFSEYLNFKRTFMYLIFLQPTKLEICM